MKKIKINGFTLIELLVVIAVIGILASIILVSYPSANKRAKDGRVKSAMAQARRIMASYGATSNYQGFGTTTDNMTTIDNEVKKSSYAGTGITVIITPTYGTSCMYVPLNEKNGATYYCADSTGRIGTTPTNPNTANNCQAATAVCPSDTQTRE